jgi:hypothetical protein
MDIDDLFIAEFPKFKLEATGHEYELDVLRVHHVAQFQKIVGGGLDKIQKLLESLPIDEAAKLVYALLKDKSDFMGSEEEVIDDEGFKVKRKVTGPEKLMQAIRLEEIPLVVGALMKSISLSMPKIGAIMQGVLDKAKKKKQASLSTETSSPTGSLSTISSPPNTVLQ